MDKKVKPKKENKQYLVVSRICPLSETFVVRGEVQDKLDTSIWRIVNSESIPGGSIIKEGSIVEKTEAQAAYPVSEGIYAPVGTQKHFNLDDVFSQGVKFAQDKEHPELNRSGTLAEVLRFHLIYTLEDIVNNSNGRTIDGVQMPAQEILRAYGDERQVQVWIEQCRALIEN